MGPGLVPEAGMSGRVVTTPNKVRSAYEDFLESFRVAVEDAAGEVLFPDRPLGSSFTDSGRATVEFARCLYLRKLPSRRLSGSKRLDIVIEAIEELEKDSWVLKRSIVRLNYFVISDATAQLAQSLHFDFVEGGQPDHPFFHVQLSDELIPEDKRQSARFDLAVLSSGLPNECWVTTRIPTSDMTLTSVLYCLAADHLGGVIFSQFARRVDSIKDRLPALRFEALRNSVQKSSVHFKSFHWFAHMQ